VFLIVLCVHIVVVCFLFVLVLYDAVVLPIAQIPLGSSRLDSTRVDMFDVSSPCILAVSSLSNSTARFARHDESDRRDSQLNLLCNFYKVTITAIHVLLNVCYPLIYGSTFI